MCAHVGSEYADVLCRCVYNKSLLLPCVSHRPLATHADDDDNDDMVTCRRRRAAACTTAGAETAALSTAAPLSPFSLPAAGTCSYLPPRPGLDKVHDVIELRRLPHDADDVTRPPDWWVISENRRDLFDDVLRSTPMPRSSPATVQCTYTYFLTALVTGRIRSRHALAAHAAL